MSNQSIPTWLLEVKDDISKTNEWNELTRHIYDAVDQHLAQSHLQYFTDLSDAEKTLLLEKAARSIASTDGGNTYENLQSKLSYVLDQSVNNQVSRRLLEDAPIETKTDLVLDTTCEGIITLLRKYPEQKYKLHVFLNQSIPQPLRFLAWQLFFSNLKMRKDFINRLASDPRSCLSSIDAEISRKCESLLNNGVTYRELRDSKGNTNSMKGVLSYYHANLRMRPTLFENEYLFAIPFIAAHFPALPKKDSPTERSMALLVEMYLQFIGTMPSALSESLADTDQTPEMDIFVKQVIAWLETYDLELLEYIRDLSNQISPPGIEDIKFFTTAKAMCAPMMKSNFSGYLSLDPLLFVWDQYVISSDVSGFHEELIPMICAIILMLLRDQIMACKNVGEVNECVRHQATLIQTRQLQTLVNKYFYKILQKKINSMSSLGPIIDPTVGRLQPWEHWHQDRIPNRGGAKQVPKAPVVIPNDNSRELEEKLRQEVNRRIQTERMLQDEINRLKRDLENSKREPPRQLPQPAPVRRLSPTPQQPKTPPTRLGDKQPVLDMLKKLSDATHKISHSDGATQRQIDDDTRESLKLHKLDLKMAEKQVFGRILTPSDWDRLGDHEKNVKSEEMLEIVKSRIQKRYAEKGKY